MYAIRSYYGFALDADGDMHVAVASQGRFGRFGQADQRDVEAFDMRQDRAELFAFAAIADGQDGIPPPDHAQVAVQRFGRVQA